ncbi:MAG: hypothetical protein KKB30_16080 [Proteobacteria bacterium]|nr:hypothetical protein [Pseudomonadota bacterium]MBU1713985.1 hypothetical protein [Pseudomonadota bacterium]
MSAGKYKNPIIYEDLINAAEKRLQPLLHELKEINGYRAACIMTSTGELLSVDSVNKKINLSVVGPIFNDIFQDAHEASKKIGLGSCFETSIKTPRGIIIIRCSGVESEIHFHTLTIMVSDGNYALMKMKLEGLIPRIMQTLLEE